MLVDAKLMAFVATTDSERAKSFYRDTLDLRFVADEPFALIFDSGGTMLRVQKVKEVAKAQYTALGWEVEDIQAKVRQLGEKKVEFLRFDGFGQDDLGVVKFPNGDRVAWFKDPDGNILSLTQFARGDAAK